MCPDLSRCGPGPAATPRIPGGRFPRCTTGSDDDAPPELHGLLAGDDARSPRRVLPVRRRSLPPEVARVARVLEEVLWQLDSKKERWSYDHITRAAGSEWQTHTDERLRPDQVAALVLDPGRVVGVRHRGNTRLAVLDIDAKPGRPSPYWHPDGPEHSAAFRRLESKAAAAGCALVTFRTPSGGWHVWMVLPAVVHYTLAAELGRLLAASARLQEAPAVLEVFPTPAGWTDADAKARKRSGGFRLPGQAGGAVWLGGAAGWNTDPANAWAEVEAALDAAEVTPAWGALLERACEARSRRRNRPAGAGRACRVRRPCRVAWTAPGQSNQNLGALANALRLSGDTAEALGARIAAAARSCSGFDRYASADTKARLDAWALSWAAACIRRPPQGNGRQQQATDPGRNYRLRREALARVIDGAVSIARAHGAAASQLSQRRIAELLEVDRMTLRKLWAIFTGRLQAALLRAAGGGRDPLPKGGGVVAPGGSAEGKAETGALSCLENLNLFPHPADNLQPCRGHPASPPDLPIAPADRMTARRMAERLELARWLGLSPP